VKLNEAQNKQKKKRALPSSSKNVKKEKREGTSKRKRAKIRETEGRHGVNQSLPKKKKVKIWTETQGGGKTIKKGEQAGGVQIAKPGFTRERNEQRRPRGGRKENWGKRKGEIRFSKKVVE